MTVITKMIEINSKEENDMVDIIDQTLKTTTTLVIVAIAAALAIMIAPMFSTAAFANVSGSTDTSCSNGGGNQLGGQQPSCTGSGLTQNTCSATTGNGKCPSGQNK